MRQLLQLHGVTPYLHHSKVPVQQSIQTMLILNGRQEVKGGGGTLWEKGIAGFPGKGLKPEGHSKGKNRINHLMQGGEGKGGVYSMNAQ